ncbi:RHS repeat-associated core domain-containing protein [Nonomuraea sp. NPDC049695]|uniref:RHS repeat-associated core domain-containing protein n=1 Tax=Nonomuraea sp. NPDC049695 TaxID=3154734 RepID=UPI003444DA4E
MAPDISSVKLGQRWYNTATGRFAQQDSLSFLGDTQTGNRYAYAACDPVNRIDPTGALSLSDYAQAGAACVEGAMLGLETISPWAVGLAALGGVSTGAVLIGGAIGGCAIGAGTSLAFGVNALTGK